MVIIAMKAPYFIENTMKRSNSITMKAPQVCVALSRSFLIAGFVLASGCGEPTKDDQREKIFSGGYKKAMKESNPCEAYKFAATRFMYIDDGLNSRYDTAIIQKRMHEWEGKLHESSMDCKRKLWPRIEPSIHSELNELRKLESLRKFSAKYVGKSLRLSSGRSCGLDMEFNNESDYKILEFSGYWAPLRRPESRFHVSHEFKNHREVEFRGSYATMKIPLDWNPINPGTQKLEEICDFDVYMEISRTGMANVDIEIKEIKFLSDGKANKISLPELKKKIDALEKKLTDGFEGVILPRPASILEGN